MSRADYRDAARAILAQCIRDLQALPSWRGQTQVVKALRRVANLSVWSK